MPMRVHKLFNLEPGEWRPALWAGLYFFCILTALMLLRPAREALGMQRGIETVRWLFMGTALVTLVMNPLFGWLVSRLPRLRFIAALHGFFVLSLLAFHVLLTTAPEAVGIRSGQLFYVWFSVFNLFITMLFWALMADCWSPAQSRRLFPLIAVGGTLGAILGPGLASLLAQPLGTPALLLVAVIFLLLALPLARAVGLHTARSRGGGGASDDGDASVAVIGGSAWAGLKALLRSRFLLGLAAYTVILTVMATFLYFTRLQMVAALGDDLDLRTTLFARIDMATQVATLVLQALISGRLMQRLGVGFALALLPVTVALGFIGLAMVASLALLIVFEASFKALQRALTRPARETLYTVLGREDKYKAKAAIDTFVYRSGDVAGAQLEGLLGKLGLGLLGLASLAVPLALLWAGLGLWLARAAGHQQRPHRPPALQPPAAEGAH